MKLSMPIMIPTEKLHPFEGHPFKVREDDEMKTLTESIVQQGILSPLIVRRLEGTEDEYEIVSGHRRAKAAQMAGIREVPAFATEMDRTEAIIALVDSNLHREHLLPSEKAYAYKMKMDALGHKGRTCGQLGHKSRDDISNEESGRQIQRYIRLTFLIPELLNMVDEGEIALTPAVELSYLTENEQRAVLDAAEYEDCTPSLSQAVQFKNLSKDGKLTKLKVYEIMSKPKANQEEKISFRVKDIRQFFPKSYDADRIQKTILRLLQNYQKKRSHDDRSL